MIVVGKLRITGGHGHDLNLAIWTLESWNLVGGNNRYYRTLEMAGK